MVWRKVLLDNKTCHFEHKLLPKPNQIQTHRRNDFLGKAALPPVSWILLSGQVSGQFASRYLRQHIRIPPNFGEIRILKKAQRYWGVSRSIRELKFQKDLI